MRVLRTLLASTSALALSFTAGRSSAQPILFVPVTPCRTVDTRAGSGIGGQWGPPALVAGATRTFMLGGRCGIDVAATALSANFTIVNAQGAGDLRIFPAGAAVPLVSTLNYVAGQTIPNGAVVLAGGPNASITVQADVSGADLVIDVNGYYGFTGSDTVVGQGAGPATQTFVGNTSLGFNALTAHTTGGGNTAVGLGALSSNVSGTGNVAIGESAGAAEVGSNKLYIENATMASPLLYGDFSVARLGVNKKTLTTTLNVGGGIQADNIATGGANMPLYATSLGIITISSSDARLKKEVVSLSDEIDVPGALSRLRGVAFRWDTGNERVKTYGDRREIGVLAQEVEAVLPHVVVTMPDGYKAVDYPKLAAFLIEVAKAQEARIAAQGAALQRQESRIRELERILDRSRAAP